MLSTSLLGYQGVHFRYPFDHPLTGETAKTRVGQLTVHFLPVMPGASACHRK
jgi:hypothetical protein